MELPEAQAAGPTAQSKCLEEEEGALSQAGGRRDARVGRSKGCQDKCQLCACHMSSPSPLWRAIVDRRLHTL